MHTARPRTLLTLGIATTAALTTFLGVFAESIDADERDRYFRSALHLRAWSSRLDEDVLRARFRMLAIHDALVTDVAEVRRAEDELGRVPPFESERTRARDLRLVERA